MSLAIIHPSSILDGLKLDRWSFQFFLRGHTGPINAMKMSSDGSILATAQIGDFPHVRLWDWQNGVCVSILRASPSYAKPSAPGTDKPVLGMAFSPDDGQFMAVTRGRLGHYVTSTWALKVTGSMGGHDGMAPKGLQLDCSLLSRHTLDCDVRCLEFSPLGPQQYVTCGEGNIRFWRVKNKNVLGQPVSRGLQLHSQWIIPNAAVSLHVG